jgi:hypothetical protein
MRPDFWKAIAVTFGALALLAGTEWFVTYCAFSNFCPIVEEIADLSVSAVP